MCKETKRGLKETALRAFDHRRLACQSRLWQITNGKNMSTVGHAGFIEGTYDQ